MSKVQIFSLIISLLLALVIFQLIRKKKLKEQYSLLWFLTVVVMMVLALWEGLLYRISSLLGIAVPSNALFMLALLFMFAMSLHYSMLVSRLTDQTKMLSQRLAILDRDIRKERADRTGGVEVPGTGGAGIQGTGSTDVQETSGAGSRNEGDTDD
ncbi:MAG: DUF2304 domain-containing protein [Actinobacteria bacterium]|nr:DUF2304 domain-containing protein [Actinomycetota bacterium]